jgi:hypothetical protein
MTKVLIFAAMIWTFGGLAAFAGPKDVVLYKNPQCGCCEGYADYLRTKG